MNQSWLKRLLTIVLRIRIIACLEVLEKALPEVLSDEQKSKKVSNLSQAMKKGGLVIAGGKNRYAKWSLK